MRSEGEGNPAEPAAFGADGTVTGVDSAEAARCADDLAALHRVSTLGPGDPEVRLVQWLEAGSHLLKARQGVVLLGLTDELVVRAAVAGATGGVAVGDDIVDRRVQHALDRRATVADLGGMTGDDDDLDLGTGSVVASPLWVSGALAGVVAFLVPTGRPPFTAWALALIDVVADGIARVLEHQADARALVTLESRAAAVVRLIPDPVVRLDRDGRELSEAGPVSAQTFDPCWTVRAVDEVADAATLDRVQGAVERALHAQALQTETFDVGRGGRSRRVEARFVPASDDEVLCIVRDMTDRHRAERALTEQVAFEALVASISTRLIGCSAAALDDAIAAGLGEIASFFAADRAFVDQLATDRASLHRSHSWVRTGPVPAPEPQPVGSAGVDWLIGRLGRAGHLFVTDLGDVPADVVGEGDSSPRVVDPEDRGRLWVRLGSGGDLAGVLGLAWRDSSPPANEEILGLVRFAADAFHGAIHRRRVALLAQGQANVFELIARNEPVSTSLLGVRELLARHTEGAVVVILTVDGDRMHLVVDQGGDPWSSWFAALPIDLDNPYGQAVVTGEPVRVTDVASDPRYGDLAVPDPALRSVSVIPVRSSRPGRALALMVLLSETPHAVVARPEVQDSAAALVMVALERDRDLQRLAHQATHDPLTGVGNRAALLDRLTMVLARARRTGNQVGVLFCDLDGFKAVNDRLGHEGGDRLLVEVADRIRAAVRPSDTVSRTGGDEFVVVCDDLDSPEQAQAIADRIVASVSGTPAQVGSIRLDVAISIGVAMADTVLNHPDRLLHAADLAMYRTKEQGRNRRLLQAISPRDIAAVPFSPASRDDEQAAAEQLRVDLSRAIGENELELLGQPLVGRDGSVAGVEVLLRWDDARPGPLGPGQIVAAANELGLASELGQWIRRRALVLQSGWSAASGRDGRPPVHVNVSGLELVSDGFVERVVGDLSDAGATSDDLVLEIRELDLHLAGTRAVLDDLDRIGVDVIVDGAGEGGVPLAELTRLPVAGIKLAPSLVSGIDHDAVGLEVVRALVLLAHGVGWRSLAVGVETSHQRSVLFGFGVDAVQGHAVIMPVDADAFSAWLAARAEPDR